MRHLALLLPLALLFGCPTAGGDDDDTEEPTPSRPGPDYSLGDCPTLEEGTHGFDTALAGQLAGLPAGAKATDNGVYLIITTPAYADACTPLLDWKREKGLNVRLATTEETGAGNAAIQAWLRNAYATWEVPPEYLLIVGDVDDVEQPVRAEPDEAGGDHGVLT